MEETQIAARGTAESPEAAVGRRIALWKDEAKALSALATAFGPLAKAAAHADLSKLEASIEKAAAKTSGSSQAARAEELLAELRGELAERRRRMQESLARELREACEERGLNLRVVRREEPVEVRIAPFAVRIDRAAGTAELAFAKHGIEKLPAEAGAIVAAHRRLDAELRKGFDAGRFFDACLRAWRAAVAAGGKQQERVEILDFLPYLALEFQGKAFRVDPRGAKFKDYSRARFAFDLMQLREAGGLRRAGWRLNLGVASGTTGSKRDRSLFVEDAHGEGEYKLSLYFTREGERA